MHQILRTGAVKWVLSALGAVAVGAFFGFFDPTNPIELIGLLAITLLAAFLRWQREFTIQRQIEWQEKHDISLVRLIRRWLKKDRKF